MKMKPFMCLGLDLFALVCRRSSVISVSYHIEVVMTANFLEEHVASFFFNLKKIAASSFKIYE
jgi:hypothetical protein